MRRLILIVMLTVSSAFAQQSFVIKPDQSTKHKSKNALKEDIGDQIKDSLYSCSRITKEIGKVQLELAELQEKLFAKVEQLVDNRKPFKKAKRMNLREASQMLSQVNVQLQAHNESMKKIKGAINKTTCLKD